MLASVETTAWARMFRTELLPGRSRLSSMGSGVRTHATHGLECDTVSDSLTGTRISCHVQPQWSWTWMGTWDIGIYYFDLPSCLLRLYWCRTENIHSTCIQLAFGVNDPKKKRSWVSRDVEMKGKFLFSDCSHGSDPAFTCSARIREEMCTWTEELIPFSAYEQLMQRGT